MRGTLRTSILDKAGGLEQTKGNQGHLSLTQYSQLSPLTSSESEKVSFFSKENLFRRNQAGVMPGYNEASLTIQFKYKAFSCERIERSMKVTLFEHNSEMSISIIMKFCRIKCVYEFVLHLIKRNSPSRPEISF